MAAIMAPAKATRALVLNVPVSGTGAPENALYQVLHANISSTEAMASMEVSTDRTRWTSREKRKIATRNHTKKWKKTMYQSNEKNLSQLRRGEELVEGGRNKTAGSAARAAACKNNN